MKLEPVTMIELPRTRERLGWYASEAACGAAPLLEVNNIEVVYNDVILVLRGLSLSVPQGKIVALLGANGAGKSTTLKAISGPAEDRGGRGHPWRDPARRRAHQRHRPASDRPAGNLPGDGGPPDHRRHDLPGESPPRRLHPSDNAVKADIERVYGYFPRLKERPASPATSRAASSRCWRSAGR